MTTQLALDKGTNDLIKLDGGGVTRVDDGRYTVQLVKNKLNTALGEWLLDPSLGWVSLKDFKKNPDLFALEVRARTIILSTPGVKMVDTFSLKLTQRTLVVSFTATTIYGGISITVPWSL